ncbi:inositol polyphosphate-5-phosphatase A-like isoform X2 [Amphiura filiformis]|uniref:inositol polyphosphate-5-phosphatase A-like isoform X2 n=1 Tax=Amphiura filiformis TaxID=82378 RepID=UPI003B216D7B
MDAQTVGPGVLLITANLGSIFEDPEHMLMIWLENFYETLERLQPHFVALHCQEVGGKNYEHSMQYVDKFLRLIFESDKMRSYDRICALMDKEFTVAEHFTALGNIYFVHESIKNVQYYDFKACKFRAITGKVIHADNLKDTHIYDKAKFPASFFPEMKWSRKGFIRTRWSIDNRVFDLVNIHLFHDASNMIAMQNCPSPYCKNRKRALDHVIKRFAKDKHEKVPYFIFGDFNFRLDTQGVIQTLVARATPEYTREDKEIKRIVYKANDSVDKVILTLGKKVFDIDEPSRLLGEGNGAKWLHHFDKEPLSFNTLLCEYPVEFPPSYPYSENIQDGNTYMKTRCPAWCDRILLTHQAKSLISEAIGGKPYYGVIGQDVCMGDHKPVILFFRLIQGTGTASSIPPSSGHTPLESTSKGLQLL